jgi:hypothetical protein
MPKVPTRLIVSEGGGDEAFFRYLVQQHRIKNYKVLERKEKDEPGGVGSYAHFLRRFKGVETGSEKYKLIVLVADNDGNPNAKFTEVINQIKSAEDYAIPTKPREIVRKPPLPAVVVLMMPWDNTVGNLETLCFQAANKQRPEIAKCVEKFIHCVKAGSWEVSQLAKLRLRCLIASSCPGDPNTSLQHAWGGAKKRPTDLIPLRDRCFETLVKWLRRLR